MIWESIPHNSTQDPLGQALGIAVCKIQVFGVEHCRASGLLGLRV